MKLLINRNGSLWLKSPKLWIQSNPNASSIVFEMEDRFIAFSTFQSTTCCEFTFSIDKIATKKDFNLIFNYPLTEHNPFIFPWLTFYSVIIN